MRPIFVAAAVAAALAACSKPPETTEAAAPKTTRPPAAPPITTPAGVYALDPSHTSVTFEVRHIGLTNFTAGFDKMSGELNFDPANPAAMTVSAELTVASLDLPAPPAGFHDELMGPVWFNAAAHPIIRFRSTRVEPTGARTARVTGDLTLRGVTRPIVLEVRYNGGYPKGAVDPAADRIGFSAQAVVKRSEFGMAIGVPAPGSDIGVGDEVKVRIETEFARG
jgi:polyisoprenoid-binding protein YceI